MNLVELLQKINEIKYNCKGLNLAGMQLNAAEAKILADTLPSSLHVHSINLGDNVICDEGAVVLAKALETNRNLEWLCLAANLITDQGAICLAEGLQKKANLRFLDLSKNQIDVEGTTALAVMLKTNAHMASLSLNENHVSNSGAFALAEALKVNDHLKSLSLKSNNIGLIGGKAIAEMLKVNSRLRSIDLSCNDIGYSGTKALAEALTVNTSLHEMNCLSGSIGDRGAKYFATMLATNKSLLRLNLSYNHIGEDGIIALAAALKENTRLQYLDLGGNRIKAKSLRALLAVLRVNTTLTDLSFGGMHPGKLCKRIESLLIRNQILQGMPFTAVRILGDRVYPPVSPFYHSDTVSDTYNRIQVACKKLINLREQINSWISAKVVPDGYDIENVNTLLLANVACFHLKSLDLATDTSTAKNPHPNIGIVQSLLTHIPRESDSYLTICLYLGEYYAKKANAFRLVKDAENQNAYAKCALSYWRICQANRAFRERDNVEGELSVFMPFLTDMLDEPEVSGLPAFADQSSQPLNMASINQALEKSLQRMAFTYFDYYLDQSVDCWQQSQPPSSLMGKLRLFDLRCNDSTLKPSVNAVKLIKAACHGEAIDAGMLRKQFEVLQQTSRIEFIAYFFSLCKDFHLDSKRISSVYELFVALEARSLLAPVSSRRHHR